MSSDNVDVIISRSRITNLEPVRTNSSLMALMSKKQVIAYEVNKKVPLRRRRSALFPHSSTVSADDSISSNDGLLRYVKRKRLQKGRLDYNIYVWLRDFVVQRHHCIMAHSNNNKSTSGDIKRQKVAESGALASVATDLAKLVRLTHENVNKMHGIILYEEKEKLASGGMQGAVIFQCHTSGSLFDVVHDEEIKLDTNMKYLFIRDIVNGVCALHTPSIGVAHGFLHTRNVVIDKRYTVLLTDYGLGFLRSNDICEPLTVERLTELETNPKIDMLLHMYISRAPELLRASDHWPQCGTFSGDVYSVAIMIVEILTRQLPYADAIYGMDYVGCLVDALYLLLLDKTAAHRPRADDDTFSAPLKGLLSKCWHDDATRRPNIISVQRELTKLPGFEHAADSIVENLVKRLESYANNLEQVVTERTKALADEIAKSEQLLLQILPRSVADALKRGQRVAPESFESVSVYFSDIVGFTSLSARSNPIQVVTLLNKLYTMFDSTLEQFHVYKVETIGDAYMVASGLPERIGARHCCEMARMSLKLLENMRTFDVPHAPGEPLALRIGLHCGPCAAGVVGIKMPRYCLFGDTVNSASRMESNGLAYKIHTSSQYYDYVEAHYPQRFTFQLRGDIDIKGKGLTTTYWLVTENYVPTITVLPGSRTASVASITLSDKLRIKTCLAEVPATDLLHINGNSNNMLLKAAMATRIVSKVPRNQHKKLDTINQPGTVDA